MTDLSLVERWRPVLSKCREIPADRHDFLARALESVSACESILDFSRFALPVMRKVWGTTPLFDLVGVQALKAETDVIYFMSPDLDNVMLSMSVTATSTCLLDVDIDEERARADPNAEDLLNERIGREVCKNFETIVLGDIYDNCDIYESVWPADDEAGLRKHILTAADRVGEMSGLPANWLVVDKETAEEVASMDGFTSSPRVGSHSLRRIGTLSTDGPDIAVWIKDNERDRLGLLGYKGSGPAEAAYIFAPFQFPKPRNLDKRSDQGDDDRMLVASLAKAFIPGGQARYARLEWYSDQDCSEIGRLRTGERDQSPKAL